MTESNDSFSAHQDATPAVGRQVLSVSQLNRKARMLLEIHLPMMWVEGEVSNFSRPSSGHWYFTLKDEGAQVRCAMFRNRNSTVQFTPKAGDQVQVRARVSLYEGRGDYQLIVEHMEESGFGVLQKRFEQLRTKLQEEGLFDASAKKPLPPLPGHLAVITSPSGAAVRDVISVLQRRFPALPVTVIPSLVQGEGAAENLIAALQLADADPRYDLILLCRGGGSIEDLWAFNHEQLARAIAACATPVVSAVGHETDFTIADFVADLRAPTPSAAAELISPDGEDLQSRLRATETRLTSAMTRQLQHWQQRVTHSRRLLRHPGQLLQAWAQRLDQLELRLLRAWQSERTSCQRQLQQLSKRLAGHNPVQVIRTRRQHLQDLRRRLSQAGTWMLKQKNAQLNQSMSLLHAVSPLNTLQRGYAIALKESGAVVRKASDVKVKEKLTVKLAEGHLTAEVIDKGK